MNDCENVHTVQNDLEVLNTILLDFEKAYNAWSELLTEQQHASATFWYDKQIETIMAYKEKVATWIIDAKQRIEERLEAKSNASRSLSGSRRSSGSRHSSTSGRVREMAKVAELQAKMALLERKQALESEVEKLRLQEQIAMAQAREWTITLAEEKLKEEANSEENVRQIHSERSTDHLPKPRRTPTISTGYHQSTPHACLPSQKSKSFSNNIVTIFTNTKWRHFYDFP